MPHFRLLRTLLLLTAFACLPVACGDDDDDEHASEAHAGDASRGDAGSVSSAAGESGIVGGAGGALARGGEQQGGAAGDRPAFEGGAAGVTGDGGAAAAGGEGGAAGAFPTCCSPNAEFPEDACGARDDGCGQLVFLPVCPAGETCLVDPESQLSWCKPAAACTPDFTGCEGHCGDAWNGCQIVSCPDECALHDQECGFDGACCSPPDVEQVCAGHCGIIYTEPCAPLGIDCGSDCGSGVCDQATNTCCAPTGSPCAPGVCGAFVADNCHQPVDCGDTCAADEACVLDHCRPKRCGPQNCGSIDLEACPAECVEGESCVQNLCVALCK